MSQETIKWLVFFGIVVLMLVLDLGIFHRKTHEVNVREALIWTGIWISISLLFCTGIYIFTGKEKALMFLNAYVIEQSLSIDNVMVFMLIFSDFNVPSHYHHKVLYWGIIGAMVMRVIIIFSGIALINRFHWIIYFFAAFLIFTGFRMLIKKETKKHSSRNFLIKFLNKHFRTTKNFHNGNFFTKKNGEIYLTPLFIVVLVIEITDLMFAVDSIPAVISITTDRYIAYTSNVFAILGLRSFYFAFEGMSKYFIYIKYGLSAILIFVGAKMGLSDFFKFSYSFSLIIILSILTISILLSLLNKKHKIKFN